MRLLVSDFLHQDTEYRTINGGILFQQKDNLNDDIKSWDFIMGVLHADISMVDCVGSYNWAFDSRAIDTTNRNLNHSAILPTWEFNSFCLLI